MTDLTMREMVLYKHGVGFFVRQGEVEGTSTTLTFRAEEVNDILKSLAVFDRAGGQIYGVHYQTPMDKEHRLANTSIRLGDYTTMVNLLQQLRGREVNLVVDIGKAQMPYTGRILGVDRHNSNENEDAYYVSLLTTDGASHIFKFTNIRQFTIKDAQSKADLTYFLDTSMTEDNRRGVTIRMSEGAHDLVVHYVAPSPTWRVSYRLVAETDENGETGTALLQGWGLFDNRFEEDLDNVQVTLVAGQPISFIYDLYASKIPERPIVEDEARVVQAPVEYRSEAKNAPISRSIDREELIDTYGNQLSDGSLDKRLGSGESIVGYAPTAEMREMMSKSTTVETETRDTGETFQYVVTTPVTVKRGESALVPIIGHDVSYQRELLYNNEKLQDHPVASLRFENESGLTLERGPVTLVEDGDYKGEAIIPFTRDKNSVYVPYAVELGVTIKEEKTLESSLRNIYIEDNVAITQRHQIHTANYSIENTTSTDKVVTIEAPMKKVWKLYDTRKPDSETLHHNRWKVNAPANSTVTFARKEQLVSSKRIWLRNIKLYFDLQEWLKNKYFDNTLVYALRDLLETINSIENMQQKIDGNKISQKAIYEKQDQIRKNMSALGTVGEEGELRLRVVAQLRESQDQLEAIEQKNKDLEIQIAETEERITAMIAELGEKYGKEDK